MSGAQSLRALAVALMAMLGTATLAADLSVSDYQQVVAAVVDHLNTDYVEADTGRRAATELGNAFGRERLVSFADGASFAAALSEQLQASTGDGHLNVEFAAKAIELETTEESFDATQMERYYGRHLNFGVQSAGRLDNNVGLLDLRVFAPIDMGGDTVAAAMNVVAHTDALIIDLRKNGGGIGEMADFVASFLFDHTVQPLTGTYDRPTDTHTQRFTQPYVPGQRFGGDKRVYVLISKKTFSAAEALAYNLQALERATIVGEASGGGAHPFKYLPVHPHFVLWSVTAKSVNPVTGTNWQGIGVVPDIPVPATEALEAALDHLKGAGD